MIMVRQIRRVVRITPIALTPAVLPQDRVLSLAEVLQFFPVSRSTWYQGVKDGKYPKPIQLSARRIAWRYREVIALVQ